MVDDDVDIDPLGEIRELKERVSNLERIVADLCDKMNNYEDCSKDSPLLSRKKS